METLSDNEVEKQFELFEKTFSSEDNQKAKEIIQYIARQLNDRTLRGFIDKEFDTLIRNSAKGLFYITYLQQMKYPEDRELMPEELAKIYSKEREIIQAKTICKSSFNMLYLLATRVYKGRDYELIGREIDSRKPIMVSQK